MSAERDPGGARLVARPVADLRAEPDAHATVTSQVLLGESVTVLERLGGTGSTGGERAGEAWALVRAGLDGYEGFLPLAALAPPTGSDAAAPTHAVIARATLLFPGPGIKRAPAVRLPLGARLRPVPGAAPTDEGLVECAGGWVHGAHLAPLDAPPAHERSPAGLLAAAIRWLDAPYLWGGRTPDGCDCSGLVQGAARAAGIALPRDSGDQERALGREVSPGDVRPGDLVFWPGHVAVLAADPALVLHANAHTLSVAFEPLARVEARAGTPRSVRRPDGETTSGTATGSALGAVAAAALGPVLGAALLAGVALPDAALGATGPIEIGGPARTLDGDTLEIGAQAIRIEGIDAPEDGQECKDAAGEPWRCGAAAGQALRELVADGVRCLGDGFDAYRRLIATCRVDGAVGEPDRDGSDADGRDVGAALVEAGLALAYVRYSERYVGEERTAREARRGVWRGAFVPPWQWRRERWREAGEAAPSPDCPIKGNVSADGTRIYHAPWSRSYGRTTIDESRGERWFCDEAEAIAAGWRAPRR